MDPTSNSFLGAKESQKNPESQLDKKLTERKEQFSSEQNISTMKEEAISSDLSLGSNEREKLFKSKRLKKAINIDTISSLISKLTISKDFYDHCYALEVNLSQFSELMQKIKAQETNSQFEALVGFRKLLSLQNPPIQECIDFGLVSNLLGFLDHPYPEFNYEALWCLTNISCGTSDQTNSIAIKGGIVKIIKLLDSTIDELIQQTIWTLGNLGGDSDRIRKQILELKAFEKILLILQTTTRPQLIKNAVFFFSQISKVKPPCSYDLLKKTIPLVIKHIYTLPEDIDYLVDAFYILSHITEVYKKSIDSIIETGVLPTLFTYIEKPFVFIQLTCLRIIGNIASGNPNQTQALLDAGVLKYLKLIVGHEKKSVRKEVSWILSNIAAGTQRQIEGLISEGYYPILVHIVHNDVPNIQKEAIWAICNLTSVEKKDMLESLIREGVLELISFCLKMKDPNQLAVSIEALGNLLEFGKKYYTENGKNLIVTRIYELGLIDVLEKLQYNPVEIIYEKTIKLLETYFETENNQ